MDLKEESVLGEDIGNHWYYRSKLKALINYLDKIKSSRVLDVGAGTGFFSKELLKCTNINEALCVDTSYKDESEEVINGKIVKYRRSCENENVDLVLMMDVLEHVDDDLSMLREYVSKVPNGTYFLITVPAFSFLWSEHDVFLEHKRRYTLDQVKKLVENAQLDVKRCSYYYGLIFPLVVAVRLFSNLTRSPNKTPTTHLKKHFKPTNSALTFLCSLELPAFRINKLAGLSVFCLAQKNKSD